MSVCYLLSCAGQLLGTYKSVYIYIYYVHIYTVIYLEYVVHIAMTYAIWRECNILFGINVTLARKKWVNILYYLALKNKRSL